MFRPETAMLSFLSVPHEATIGEMLLLAVLGAFSLGLVPFLLSDEKESTFHAWFRLIYGSSFMYQLAMISMLKSTLIVHAVINFALAFGVISEQADLAQSSISFIGSSRQLCVTRFWGILTFAHGIFFLSCPNCTFYRRYHASDPLHEFFVAHVAFTCLSQALFLVFSSNFRLVRASLLVTGTFLALVWGMYFAHINCVPASIVVFGFLLSAAI